MALKFENEIRVLMLSMVLVDIIMTLIDKFSKLNDQRGIYPFTEGIKKKSQSPLESKVFQLGNFKASAFSNTTNGLKFLGRSK